MNVNSVPNFSKELNQTLINRSNKEIVHLKIKGRQ
jgi:hypothetical protein